MTGPEALTSPESLEIIGAVTGQRIAVVELDDAQSREHLRHEGFSAGDIDKIVGEPGDPTEGHAQVSPAVPAITGRPARTFAQWVAEHADAFRA